MILESLLELVKTLKARIDAHSEQLQGSEALTRYALIDPLLRELGWDTGDPALVIPEYASGHGKADYALLSDSKPIMMVEAKKLGTQLGPVVIQVIGYCLMEGTEHFSVTDGQRWQVYETHKTGSIDEKRVVDFDLRDQSAAEVCLKALALWRQSIQAGQAIAGQNSIFGQSEDTPVPSEEVALNNPPPPPPAWHPLTQVKVTKGVRPIELQFPDGSKTQLENWNPLAVETVRWLTQNKMLNASHCPVLSKNLHRCVHTEPVHEGGQPFVSYVQVNGLFVEKVGFATATISRTQSIIEHVGQDPAQFSVRFS